MRLLSGCVLLAALFACLLTATNAFTVTVGANTEECFFENIERSQKVVSSYNVAAGGSLDIDLKVLGPDMKVVYETKREQEGSFVFITVEPGIYRFCFINTMSTITSKTVSFHIYVGNAYNLGDVATQEHVSPLESGVMVLREGINAIRDEQSYMKVRERYHSKTNESTASRVLWWSIAETIILVVMSLWQIYYLRHFFETKRAY